MRAWPAFLAILVAACGGVGVAASATPDPVQGSVNVFAAASLTEAFKQVGAEFHSRHPGANVQFEFGGSSTLVTNLTNGAQADVFASADEPNMAKVTAAGLTAGPPQIFATNRLEIVVEAGNPRHITGLADLAKPGLIVVLGAPSVPAGRYAGQALQAAGVKVTPASQELDVKAIVTKVVLGEADAGIVYVTDVRAGGARVAGVPIPEAQNVVARYPVARLRGGTAVVAGEAFVEYLLGTDGQKAMARFGFTGP